ncbi:MAG: dehydrogenase [Saprospiraceae bacterium]|nr:dehydrogenase [Saprospiraceae bacterium]
MIWRSKAPFRLGLAGGGTDLSPYCDLHGGAILNVTISLYAHSTIELFDSPKVIFNSIDQNTILEFDAGSVIPLHKGLDLQIGLYNYLVKNEKIGSQGFRITTHMDVPAGSGLGTSSTLMVSMLKVYSELLNIPFGDYDLAHKAYEIERIDLGLAGGRQDQYAATFGGVNYMEFYKDDKVIVNPLRIKLEYLNELENNIILFFTSSSRSSSDIIKEQVKNVSEENTKSIEAMHQLKEQSRMMKEALLKGKLHEIGEILDFGFQQKKKMAQNISNSQLDEIYEEAKKAGATGGKISGAGGGGFMFFYCPGVSKYKVIEKLKRFDGEFRSYQFTPLGARSWKTE